MYVRVAVYPSSKKEVIKNTGDSRFEIRVKEPAERNLANSRVIEILALEYKVSPKLIRIVSGHHSSRKIFSVADES
jgi:uncharacterized protein YggU (UPF0235/DUF167 family)